MDDECTRTTVALVAGIPPGRVLTYGRVAAEVAERLAADGGAPRGGPRQAAHVLRVHGPSLPWWRVVSVDGRVACRDPEAARAALRAEGVPFAADGERVAVADALWQPGG
ncbi:MGMT family protein [Cellulomonas hominis]|uniref:MGMT family protein n=1 Tax=Cellulomonas hominis TaxID=156981 RepID=UPI0027DFE204|nr:MGMT family protein [Cellulomonas hominis]